jgi:hypothetical protein
MKYLFLFLVGTLTLFSCRYIGGKRVRGNGNVVTQDRTISGFQGIESLGSFDVTIIPSSTTSVKVEADENLQQYIETDVENNKLQIRTRKGYNLRPRGNINIEVYTPLVTSIEAKGSGSITGKGLLDTQNGDVELRVAGSGNIDVEMNAQRIDGEIAGSGNLNIRGTARRFDGDVMGSGNIRAGNLKTEDSKVEIAGSGNVEVFASNKLDVKVMGSGEVRHRGPAQVSTRIMGSGSVVKID